MLLTLLHHLIRSESLRAGEGEGPTDGGVVSEAGHGHFCDVLSVEVGDTGLVVGAPNALLFKDGNGVGSNQGLHEAAEAESGVVEARLFEVALGAALDAHEGDLRVLFALIDGEEDEAWGAHGDAALDEAGLGLPVDLGDGLLWAAGGAVNDSVHANKGRREVFWVGEIALHCGGAPLA